MKRSARRRDGKAKRRSLLRAGLAAAGEAAVRNPGLAGGVTAFTVTFLFIAANAIWYQPHAHEGAFFATRDMSAYRTPDAGDGNETVILIERDPADPAVEAVQRALSRLELYSGEVDGISGPLTREAVEEYQRIAGIEVSGEIDADLMRRLEDRAYTRPAAVALPRAAPTPVRFDAEQTASVSPVLPIPRPSRRDDLQPAAIADPQVVRIQAGLRAFGNDNIEIDGVVGAETEAAIREFQSLFGLPVTGQPDDVLYAKMQEIGLTN